MKICYSTWNFAKKLEVKGYEISQMGVSSEKLWHEVIAGSMLQANNSEILPQEETEEYFIRAEYRASKGHVRMQEDEV